MTPFLNNSILIAISKHGGSCGGPFLLPLFLFFDYTARGILSSFTLMGKTIWWYLHLPIWVCSPVKGRDMCYASKLSVRWSHAGIINSSWDWDVPSHYCCCSAEISEYTWLRTSQWGLGLNTNLLALWPVGSYVAYYVYIFLINIQIYLRAIQYIMCVCLEAWWLLYSTKSQ